MPAGERGEGNVAEARYQRLAVAPGQQAVFGGRQEQRVREKPVEAAGIEEHRDRFPVDPGRPGQRFDRPVADQAQAPGGVGKLLGRHPVPGQPTKHVSGQPSLGPCQPFPTGERADQVEQR